MRIWSSHQGHEVPTTVLSVINVCYSEQIPSLLVGTDPFESDHDTGWFMIIPTGFWPCL